MGYTKRDLVVMAFEEIGYASYIYDAMPEQLESVLRQMDSMLAAWNAKGIRIGYPIPSSPNNSSLDEQTGVSDGAIDAIGLNLAVKISPRFGKTPSQITITEAKKAFDALLIKAVQPTEMQLPNTMPSGAGNKPWRVNNRPFLNTPIDPLLAGPDAPVTFE